ncbi:MAG: hypothetical protein ACFWTI_03400 [Lactobacillus helveticus]
MLFTKIFGVYLILLFIFLLLSNFVGRLIDYDPYIWIIDSTHHTVLNKHQFDNFDVN